MKLKCLVGFLCALLLISYTGAVYVSAEGNTDTVAEAQGLIDGIVALHLSETGAESVQEWIGGGLSQGAGVRGDWYILALSQSGDFDFSAYEEALLSYLAENEVHSASSRLKYALCLAAVGSTDGYISAVLEEAIGAQGIMSRIYGLHLLSNGYVSGAIGADALVESLLSLQCEDGGWSLTGGTGDVDVTAMTVQALAPYRDTADGVRAAADSALDFLSRAQTERGDYLSYGVANPESTVQVLVALSALGVDGETDARFIKNGNTLLDAIKRYRLSDGSFCHTDGGARNENATAQVFYGMVAYLRMADGRGSLYLLDHSDPAHVEPAPVPPSAETGAEVGSAAEEGSAAQDGTDPAPAGAKSLWSGYRPWVMGGVLLGGCLVCLVLYCLGKRRLRGYLAVMLAAVLAACLVAVTDIRSAEEYYNGESASKANAIGQVTLTVRCDTVAGRAEYIPENGVILAVTSFAIEEGDTVYDILTEAARQYHIQVESNGTSEMAYVAGIGYLYEHAFGELSGWIFRVNGVTPSEGCGSYRLSDGDAVEWHYTCDMGQDIP